MTTYWILIKTAFIACIVTLGLNGAAFATIYRCNKDPEAVTLTNLKPSKDCKKMNLPPLEKRSKKDKQSAAKAGNSSSAPISSSAKDKASSRKASQDAALTERSRIISEEMDLEKSRLEAVNLKIKELEKIPKLTPEQQKELLSYQKKQGLYQANIDLLQKEMKKMQ